jgi:glycosyltransferase involved in cell wall biosynthesis
MYLSVPRAPRPSLDAAIAIFDQGIQWPGFMSSAAPDVSVIIPAYNCAEHLAASIDSALAQQGVSLEVIVVDDESSDGTREVINTYSQSITAITQKNAGAYVARNNAAAVARGEWLAFLDADDLWDPQKLRKQLGLAGADIGLIYSDCSNLGASGRVGSRVSDVHTLHEGDIFEALLKINFIPTSTVLMRRRRFEELGGFATDIRGCADWDMWLRHSVFGGRVGAHPEALATYRWHPGQMSKSFAARQQDRLKVIARAIEQARARGRKVSGSSEREAYSSSWAAAAWFVAPTDRLQAVKWCLRALAAQPLRLSNYKLLINSAIGRV